MLGSFSLGAIYDRLLGADPAEALTFAAVPPLFAAGATTMIAQPRGESTRNMPMEGSVPAA